jgi:2-methylisocitrate lyase-like PEP mutase family enzyme
MNQVEKAHAFRSLHITGAPLVLYNIWDASGAKVIASGGAQAVATGSWSLAAAHGFEDGEAIPLEFLLNIAARIVQSVDLPVSIDFEGGYAIAPDQVAANVGKLIDIGAVGLNFEDRVVGGVGLHSVELQSQRLAAIRQCADDRGVALFVNARTDLFLGSDPETHAGLVAAALEREAAYAKAGADGFFIPGLTDKALIKQITAAASLPVNVMMMGDLKTPQDVTDLNVSRISYGPTPFFNALNDLKKQYNAI